MGERGADRPDVVASDQRSPMRAAAADPTGDPQTAPPVPDGQGAGPAGRRVVPLGARPAGLTPDPTDASPGYLRFEGILDEHLRFQRAPGYEVDAPQPGAGDGRFEVVLLDAGDEVLARVRPAVDFASMPADGLQGPRVTNVRADVPFDDQAAALEFRSDGRVLHRDRIPSRPPTLQHVVVTPDDGRTPSVPPHLTPTGFATSTTGRGRAGGDRLRIQWQASSPVGEDVTVDLLLRDGDGREHAFARGLTGGPYVADVSRAHVEDVTLVVRATDGVRSAEHRSPLHLEPTVAHLDVIEPTPSRVPAPGQRYQLQARVDDPTHPDAESALVWRIDGEVVGRGRSVLTAPPALPGEHTIELIYAPDGTEQLRRELTLVVPRYATSGERWDAPPPAEG